MVAFTEADGWLRAPWARDPMRKVLTETMSLTPVLRRVQELLRRASMEDGQAMVEYALLLSLLSLVAFGAVNEFGLGVSSLYSRIVAVYP